MNKGKELVPGLRFPEFKMSGQWQVEPFGDIYGFKPTNSFTRDDLTHEEGTVKNIHYGDIHTKYHVLFDIGKENVPFVSNALSLDKLKIESYCIDGDVIFADASEDLQDIGKCIEVVNLNGEKLLSGLHTILARQKQRKLKKGFAGYLFTSQHIRSQIQKEAQGAKVLGISAIRLSKISVFYPRNQDEQQKIADCLSSVDDLIKAQTQKLDILKDHKKGLMQKLFPTKGETVPKLRFKGFENAGNWNIKTLSQVAGYENGKAHEREIEDEGNFIVVNSKFISSDGAVKKYTNVALCPASKEDILMVLSDVPNGKAIAKCFLVGLDNLYSVNQRICRIMPRTINFRLLFYLLNRNPYYLSFDDGVKQTNLRKEDVLNCPLLIPINPKEQQKIADCLSSLDELIDATAQKIKALNAHKKGLMQRLFPTINQTV